MCYLYGRRCVGEITELVRAIREEIYDRPYEKVNWNKARNQCAKVGGGGERECDHCSFVLSSDLIHL